MKKILFLFFCLFFTSNLSAGNLPSGSIFINDFTTGLITNIDNTKLPLGAASSSNNNWLENYRLEKRLGTTRINSNYTSSVCQGASVYSTKTGVQFIISKFGSNVIRMDVIGNTQLLISNWDINAKLCLSSIFDTAFINDGVDQCVMYNATYGSTRTITESEFLDIRPSNWTMWNERGILSNCNIGVDPYKTKIYYTYSSALANTPQFLIDSFRNVHDDFCSPITGQIVWNGTFWIFTRHSTFKLVGWNPNNWVLQKITGEYGCIDGKGLAAGINGIYVPTASGIKIFDGSIYQSIGFQIDDIYKSFKQFSNLSLFELIDSKVDWQQGVTKTNIDTQFLYTKSSKTSIDGSIVMVHPCIVNFDFDLNTLEGWELQPSGGIWNTHTEPYDGIYSLGLIAGSFAAAGKPSFKYQVLSETNAVLEDGVRKDYSSIGDYHENTIVLSPYIGKKIRIGFFACDNATPKYWVYSNTFTVAIGNNMKFFTKYSGSGGTNFNIYIDYFYGKVICSDTAEYVSKIIDTHITNPCWGIFESDYTTNGATVVFYVRSAKTSTEINTTAWLVATPNFLTAGLTQTEFVQIRILMSRDDIEISPQINSVKLNYTANTLSLNSLAGFYSDNAYYLSGQIGTENDCVLRYSEKLKSWTKFDWHINYFMNFYDRFCGVDSRNGKFYWLLSGNTDDGESIAFNYETPYLGYENSLSQDQSSLIYLEKNVTRMFVTGKSSDYDTLTIGVHYNNDENIFTGYYGLKLWWWDSGDYDRWLEPTTVYWGKMFKITIDENSNIPFYIRDMKINFQCDTNKR